MINKSLILRTYSTLLLIILLTALTSYGQTYNQYLKSSNIDEKCAIADKLVINYYGSDTDSLKIIGKNLLHFSTHIQNKKGIYTSYIYLGRYFSRVGKEKESIERLRKAKNYFSSVEDYNKTTELYNDLGNAFQNAGKDEEACKWYERSISYGDLASDELVTQMARINLAQAQNKLGKYEEAKKNAEIYRDWSLKLALVDGISNAFAVLGSIELNQENYKQACSYFEQSYKFAVRSQDYSKMGNAYTNLGIAKYLEEDFKTSEQYFSIAVEFRNKLKNVSQICEAYLNYGGILFERGKYELAIKNYLIGLETAEKHGKHDNALELLIALKEVYTIYDIEKLEEINKKIDKENEELEKANQNFKDIDTELLKELNRSDRIRKSGYLSKNDKWPFYIGVSLLFIVSFLIAIRKNK